jgi:creatinine amidohydrolase
MAVIEDVALSLTESGFREIIFINGHYTNYAPINMACLNVHPRLPAGTKAYAINYWDALPAEELQEYSSVEAGMHANIGETSCVMVVRPELVHLDRAEPGWPDLSELKAPIIPIIGAYFETHPGSMYHAAPQGTWGDPRDSTPERGEMYYEQIVRAVNELIDDILLIYARFEGGD